MPQSLRDQVEQLANDNEILRESLVDAQLSLEDRGWERIGAFGNNDEFDRTYLQAAARQCRASAVLNPLIGRAINLRTAYVWAQGVSITAASAGEDGQQDVNTIVQAFLDDPSNKASFTSGQAREELERALGTDGNVFLALPTSPLSGRVQVRSVPFGEIDDVLRNPEDRDDVWFYKRTYTVVTYDLATNGITTGTRTVTVFHPDVHYRPRQRPKSIDGYEVRWDQPIVHVTVNRLDGWKYGIGDVYPAIGWARGYSEFLQDWAKLMKALAKVAWQTTAKSKAGAANVRQRVTGQHTEAGSMVVTGQDQKIEAVSKSGATIDANSGRPLAAMVAAATDLPVTMLLADPGVTGARATAETLDKPLELLLTMRQSLHADVLRTILGYVIDAAVRAPQGGLRGTVSTDPATGLDVITLLGDTDRTVDVRFPPLDEIDPSTLVKAIVEADATQKLPPLLVARLLMQSLKVQDVDTWLADLTDADGNFVPPEEATQARSVLASIAAGGYPTDGVAPPSDAMSNPMDDIETKAMALGQLIRAGVKPEDAAKQVGLSNLSFTGQPVSIRQGE